MTFARRSRLTVFLSAAAAPAVLLAAAVVLLVFPPSHYGFYPQCPVYRYFHILCPGCGSTRALSALFQGQIFEALRLNPLTTLLTLVTATYMTVYCRAIFKDRSFRWPQPPQPAIYATLAAVILFGIIRNL